jgi:predicted phosphodiesterase
VELAGCLIYILHDIAELDIKPAAAKVSVVVYGHSHEASIREQDGVMYLNPGSAGPRRFSLPVTVALLRCEDGRAKAEIVPLSPAG